MEHHRSLSKASGQGPDLLICARLTALIDTFLAAAERNKA